MKLNHLAHRVADRYFETVVSLFVSQLGFNELRRSEQSIWLRMPGANIDLQFSRSTAANRDEDKRGSQISFITQTPEQDLEALAGWLRGHGFEPVLGSWSDKEFYLDLPEAFVDFVIEAMTPDLAEYPGFDS